ncbi:retinal homeobox protein Rx2-like [Gigantopelta aegis]|uniref:retinal homeobox protein Rx2-like n=1 Tax=Gigantopelta aegis TaxID=1735272 RepID=UPI001B889A7C|nr:retinal homeobox protein Rx2-like [Gigantopelta aegis]
MTTITDFSIEAILGLKKEIFLHVPRCVSHSAILAVPPRHQARRNRTIFTDDDVMKMQRIFEVNQYPNIHLREQLEQQTGIPESRIQVWFQNRRNRSRRSGSGNASTSTCNKTSNQKRKPSAPLTLLGSSELSGVDMMMSPAVKDPLFQLPTLVSPLLLSPALHPRLFSVFQFPVAPISPLPQTPAGRGVTFVFPDVPPCRSWMDVSNSFVHFTRPADHLDSSCSSPELAVNYNNDVDDNSGDDDDDNHLIIDFDAC